MAENSIGAYARVTLTVNVNVTSTWGADCTIEQIHKQAGEEAVNAVHNLCIKAGDGQRLTVVGKPKVEAVIATKNF